MSEPHSTYCQCAGDFYSCMDNDKNFPPKNMPKDQKIQWRKSSKKEYFKKYYQTHKEKIQADAKAWVKNNPIRRRETERIFWTTNREMLNAKRREYSRRNPEKTRAAQRKWREKNREKRNRSQREWWKRNKSKAAKIKAAKLQQGLSNEEEERSNLPGKTEDLSSETEQDGEIQSRTEGVYEKVLQEE